MKLARVLGAIGRGLISAGVIVLLFVGYQLWGTGIQHSAAQGDLGTEFEETTGIDVSTDTASLAEAARESQEAIGNGQILANNPDAILGRDDDNNDETTEADGPRDAAPTFRDLDFDEAEQQALLTQLYPEAGEAFARIIIPDINVDQISVEGVSVEDLRKGPGHYRTTPNPGQAGNAAIAGHRTTYGAPFHRVDELEPGDSIWVTTAQGVFEYQVLPFANPDGAGEDVGYFIVDPSDTWVLDQTPGQNLLTLTACHPKFSARQRIIVQAELVGEPAPTIPRDEAVDFVADSIDSGSDDEFANENTGVTELSDERAQEAAGEEAPAEDEAAEDDTETGDATEDAAQTDDTETGADETEDAAAAAAGDNDATGTESHADAATGDIEATQAATDEVELSTNGDIERASAQTPFSTDDFGEGLNGDPTKVRPAIMWGIAALFVWITAWFAGQRLERRWTMYLVAMAPFLLLLWSTFVNVDQALPSY